MDGPAVSFVNGFVYNTDRGKRVLIPATCQSQSSTRQGYIVGRTGANHFPNTFAVSLNPMRGCDNNQICHTARMERIKQLDVFAAALLQLLLLLLPLRLLPCPHCLCHSSSAVVSLILLLLLLSCLRVLECASGYILNYNTAVAPDPAHRSLNACSSQQARRRVAFRSNLDQLY